MSEQVLKYGVFTPGRLNAPAEMAALYWSRPGSTPSSYDVIPSTFVDGALEASVSHFSIGFIGYPCSRGEPCTTGTLCRGAVVECSPGYPVCTPSFATAASIAHTDAVGPLAVTDFNQDGRKDIAVVSLWGKTGGPANKIAVYYGDGTGTQFSPGPVADTGSYPHSLEIGHGLPGLQSDFLLVAATDPTDYALNFYYRDPVSGGFARKIYPSIPPRLGDAHALVVNQPGFFVGSTYVPAGAHLVDVAYAGLLRNQYLPDLISADATAKGNTSAACGEATYMAAGDINGDGFEDVLLACPELSGIEVHYFAHNLTVGYLDTQLFATPPGPNFVAVGEDGKFFVSANTRDNSVSIFVRQPGNTFARTDYATAFSPSKLAIADIDNDGAVDLVVGQWDQVSVFYGSNSGARVPGGQRYDLPLQIHGYALPVAADLDGDGVMELVVQGYDNSIVVLRNECNGGG